MENKEYLDTVRPPAPTTPQPQRFTPMNPSRDPANFDIKRGAGGKTLQAQYDKADPNKAFFNIDLENDAFDPEYLLGKLRASTYGQIENRKAQSELLRQQQRDILDGATKRQDLSPLLAYVDSVSGLNLSKGYTSPENEFKVTQAQLQQLKNAVAGNETASQQDLISLDKNYLGTMLELEKTKKNEYLKGLELALKGQDIMGKASKGKELTKLKGPMMTQLLEANMALDSVRTVTDRLYKNKDLMGISNRIYDIPGSQLINKDKFERRALMMKDINTMIQRVGKMMEGGVLKKDDVERYQVMLNNPNVSFETVQTIMNELLQKTKSYRRGMLNMWEGQGFDIYNTGGQGLDFDKEKAPAPKARPRKRAPMSRDEMKKRLKGL